MVEKAVDRRGVNRGLFSALFDDRDYQRLPAEARLVLLTARLCKQAGPGVIFRYYPEVLAHQTGLTLRRVEAAVDALKAARFADLEDGVLWIRNGLRYDPNLRLSDPKHLKSVARSLADLPRAEIVLRFCDYYHIARPFEAPSETYPTRSKEKGVRSKEPPSPHDSHERHPAGQSPLETFERFWTEYPRRIGKPATLKAWLSCPRQPKPSARHDPPCTTPDAVLAGLTCWSAYWVRQQTPEDRIPYPATWLNDRRWETPPAVPKDPYDEFPRN